MPAAPINPWQPGGRVLLLAQPGSASRIRTPRPSCRPFQIKLKEIFETPSEIALVLELVTGGELFDRYARPRDPHPGSYRGGTNLTSVVVGG